MNLPCASLVVLRVKPVSNCLAVIAAAETMPPLASATAPRMLPATCCAPKLGPKPHANTRTQNNLDRVFKASPRDRIFEFPTRSLQTHSCVARCFRLAAGSLLFFRWASVRELPARWAPPRNSQEHTDSLQARQYLKNTSRNSLAMRFRFSCRETEL